MGLRGKFNLVLVIVFTVGLVLAGFLSYRIVQDSARQDVVQDARIMMEAATAVRAYTTNEIRPLLEGQLEFQFLPQTVPSFAAQSNLDRVRERFPAYAYNEPALNPTNPADIAAPWQADIINTFRDQPDLLELLIEREAEDGRKLVLAQPISVSAGSCLGCHSTPDAAPPSMVDLYGEGDGGVGPGGGGFGWTMGEIVAAKIVEVPMSVPLDRARTIFIIFLAALAAVFLIVIILLNVLLQYIVIKPVVTISRMASQVSMGDLEAPEYVRKGGDEIASLSSSFNRMRRSLENAMKMLGE